MKTKNAMAAIAAIATVGVITVWSLSDESSEARHLALLRAGPPSLGRDLASRRFRVGTDFDELARAWRPTVTLRHGRYTTAVYGHIGPEIVSWDHTYVAGVDGKLVHASGGGCVWSCTFFSALTEEERTEWGGSLSKATITWVQKQSRNNQRRAAAMAVAGAGAVIAHPVTEPEP